MRPNALLLTLSVGVLTFVWRFHDLFGVLGTIQLTRLSIAAGLLLFLIRKDKVRDRRFRHPIVKIAAVLVALMALSVPTSLYPGLSLRFLLNDHLKTILLFGLLIASIRGLDDLEWLAGVHLFGATVYSAIAFLRFDLEASGRLGNLYYYDSNDLALLLVATIPLAAYFVRPASTGRMRLLAMLALLIMGVTLVRTGSRGGFLALIGVGAYLLFAYRAIPKRVRIGAVAGLLALLLVTASDVYWGMMSTLLNPTEDANWTRRTGRRQIWTRGVGYMLSRPLTGVGADAFQVAEGTLGPGADLKRLGVGFKWSAAHNSFVEIGAELGVFGLLAFTLLLFHAVRTAWGAGARAPPHIRGRIKPLSQAIVGSLIGFLIAGFFLSQAYSAFLYTVLAMVVGLDATARMSASVHPARSRRAPMLPRRPVESVRR